MSDLIITYLPMCPHCLNENATFFLCHKDESDRNITLSFWKCSHCNKGICGESTPNAFMNRDIFSFTSFINVYQKPFVTEAPEYTPDPIASYYKTALRGKGNADYSAAGLMARKALEVAVNLHEATGKNLKEKIQNLHVQHVITDSLAEWAHEIRAIGNEAAHEDDLLSKEDAEQIVYFAEMLFTYLFTLPGMLAERRK